MQKNTFYVLLFFISLISCNEEVKKTETPKESIIAKESEEKSYPLLKFSKKVFDFKTISEGEILKADFKFNNPSKDTLRIEYVNPECTCTTYELSSYTIPPNEDGFITLTYDSDNRVGKNTSYTIVKANTKTKFYKLTLRVTVE
ncbi:hypothetical protein IMCC3317_38050 [Kordia antarctica]|uniref:DUF1573 domain-containing protein n=1 Tax=Kordia antarctica TaxID=1218801 RepID=A0A7L4ZP33_9FLAO|nr:DUF1573 domain-containing protein [Kordia antarctica]QHI38412.1 hypothetical protein IMCC3317_38050 [Kordia antarctica]